MYNNTGFKEDIEKVENIIGEVLLFSMPFFVAFLVKIVLL